jgi:hypothetical protein
MLAGKELPPGVEAVSHITLWQRGASLGRPSHFSRPSSTPSSLPTSHFLLLTSYFFEAISLASRLFCLAAAFLCTMLLRPARSRSLTASA